MGLLTHFLERRGQLENPEAWFLRAFGISPIASGVDVTPTSALAWTALAAGIRVLAETIASLPLKLYERLDPRGKDLLDDHPLFPLLHNAPNPEMTSFEWREISMFHVLLWGNAFSEIVRNGQGEITELWPINPDRVRVERDSETGAIVYRITLPRSGSTAAGAVRLPADRVFHLRGFSLEGIVGLSPVFVHKEAIGLGLVTELFGARFFGNGATPGGILEHPGRLTDEVAKRLRTQWDEVHGGVAKAHRVAIAEEGMKWKDVAVEPEKAQFLGLRKFQVTEAARILRIPPHLLGDLERATFSNIEQMAIEFVEHSLRPWLVRWEQRIWQALIHPRDQQKVFAEFSVEGLLRGDIEARFQAYAVGREWGWLSANDIREKENQNPVDGGDEYVSLQERITALGVLIRAGYDPVQSLDVVGLPAITHTGRLPITLQQDDLAPTQANQAGRRMRLLVESSARRVARLEVERLRTKAEKLASDPAAWRAWVTEFYAEWPSIVAEQLQLEPALARRYAEAHRDQLLAEGLTILTTWTTKTARELAGLVLPEGERHDDI